jgi:photosystem II stability/assembly factor-like uncharacterized protein
MIRTRWVLAVGLGLLTAACGSATATSVSAGGPLTATPPSLATSPANSPAAAPSPVTTPPSAAAIPAVAVTPDTALAGGQPLTVRLTGFPPHDTIELYECVAVGDCDQGPASYAGIGDAGSATVTFDAQPSVLVGSSTTPTRCDRQCILVAVAVKEARGVPPKPALTATAPLAFASSAGTADLAYSSLLSTSWISVTEGWALAAQPCAAGTCTLLAHTTDGGQYWQVLPDPPAAIQEGTTNCTVNACVSQVSFASSTVGYLYGPALLMTTDGGLTWHVQPGLQTGTLTVAGGQVYRGAFTSDGCPGPCQPSLQEAPAGSADWRTIIGQITEPDRGNFGQIAVSGPDVLVDMIGSLAGPFPANAIVYRSADGGATWARLAADPCSGLGPGGSAEEDDLTGLAAAPGGFFVGLCYRRESMGSFVITSTDGGATWQATAAAPSGQALGLVTAVSPGTIAVATEATGGNGSWTAQLLETTDGGGHWDVAATDVQDLGGDGSAPAWIGFETPLAGQWLGDPHGIWTTADGGLHWTRTAFR